MGWKYSQSIRQGISQNSNQMKACMRNIKVKKCLRKLLNKHQLEPQMERVLKLVVIGDAGVGKTSFIQRYVEQTFRTEYKPTIGVDFGIKVLQWSNDTSLKIHLWDIAGQERYASLTRVYYRGAHGCIIMFDLTKHMSFESAVKWKRDLDSKCQYRDGTHLPCLLVGNKCDLAGCEVEHGEIEEMVRYNSFIGWQETSVKENLMIDQAIGKIIQEVMNKEYKLEGKLATLQKDKAFQLRDNRKRTKRC